MFIVEVSNFVFVAPVVEEGAQFLALVMKEVVWYKRIIGNFIDGVEDAKFWGLDAVQQRQAFGV